MKKNIFEKILIILCGFITNHRYKLYPESRICKFCGVIVKNEKSFIERNSKNDSKTNVQNQKRG